MGLSERVDRLEAWLERRFGIASPRCARCGDDWWTVRIVVEEPDGSETIEEEATPCPACGSLGTVTEVRWGVVDTRCACGTVYGGGGVRPCPACGTVQAPTPPRR
jgi:hypothetical protein